MLDMGYVMLGQATDIAGVITEVTTYKTSAITLGIAIFLFVIGRRVVAKLAK